MLSEFLDINDPCGNTSALNTDSANSALDLGTLARPASSLSIAKRIELCSECIESVAASAEEWTLAAVRGKGLADNTPLRAEDILSGPTVVCRQLQLTIQTLSRLAKNRRPVIPGTIRRLNNGQLSVPVFPANGLYDSLTFMGLKASVRMQPGVEQNDIHGGLIDDIQREESSGVSVVLGAGNVSSIPATDTLNRILFEGQRVALKLNPVNDYLAFVFESAFAPLINNGLLKLFSGGGDVGAQLVNDDRIGDVHITGAADTHDRIVWGNDAENRKQTNTPLINKSITSELGNVTPWIIVPGEYTERQLHSQAQHLTASITNNASFNCLATKVIVTWAQWPQRQRFLDLIQHYLAKTPPRPAYYPGAIDRFEKFAGRSTETDDGSLPWTLLVDQSIESRPELFEEESFVCVCAETQLAAKSPEDFLAAATDFVNERLYGTLCASVTMPSGFRKRSPQTVESCLQNLRYGSVCLNQWSGLAYGLISPPWGAYPGATLANVESGIGSVHNTYLLDRYEKTVLEGPLINFPKPVWFSTHSNGIKVAERLLQLYHRPSIIQLPKLFLAALRG